jgi:PKD repeat protein
MVDPATGQTVTTFLYLNNTSDTSQNPLISFKYSGTYSVCLQADNSLGKANLKCKQNYINVKFVDNMCGTRTRTTEKYGSLYDDGGSGTFSANGQTCKYLIKTCSDDVKLTFKEFNLPAGSYLRLYDGFNNRGTPIWDNGYGANGITGLMNDPKFDTFLYATKTGAVYIEFQKGTAAGVGFKFEWESFGTGSYTAPQAVFSCFDTGCIVYPMTYTNTSTPNVNELEFYWDFDGNSTIDANTVNGSYLASFTGLEAIYNTRLVAENCGGFDTFTKAIVLINPLAIENSEFSADVTQPVVFQDRVNFIPTGKRLECVNKWNWYINPTGKYFYEQGYSSTSQFPKIVFTDTVCYDVTLVVGNVNSASTLTITKPCYIKPITYCTPKILVKHQDIGIGRVKIGVIDNSSLVGAAAYTSYTNLGGTDLFVNQPATITVERPTNFNAMNRKVWIDYNRDGFFDAINELVAHEDSARTLSWTGTFTVPSSAAYGATVLRIGTSYANYSNTPCGPN